MFLPTHPANPTVTLFVPSVLLLLPKPTPLSWCTPLLYFFSLQSSPLSSHSHVSSPSTGLVPLMLFYSCQYLPSPTLPRIIPFTGRSVATPSHPISLAVLPLLSTPARVIHPSSPLLFIYLTVLFVQSFSLYFSPCSTHYHFLFLFISHFFISISYFLIPTFKVTRIIIIIR